MPDTHRCIRAQLSAGRLPSLDSLFASIAALEAAWEGTEPKTPGAIRKSLSDYFEERGWTWPRSISAWEAHVRKHPSM